MMDLTLKLDNETTIPISRDTRICHFAPIMQSKKEANFMLECFVYNPLEDKFPSLFENIVLGNL